jgi:putative Holliday junction resolvase
MRQTGSIRMRILAIDYGTRRMGIAISDELQVIAQPLEYIPAEPFNQFLERLKQLIREKEVSLILVGLPRNMDGSYGPAALKVQEFVAVLKDAIAAPIKTWDERLTSAQANRFLLQTGMRRDKRKQKVDQTAAAILLQSYLESLGG